MSEPIYLRRADGTGGVVKTYAPSMAARLEELGLVRFVPSEEPGATTSEPEPVQPDAPTPAEPVAVPFEPEPVKAKSKKTRNG